MSVVKAAADGVSFHQLVAHFEDCPVKFETITCDLENGGCQMKAIVLLNEETEEMNCSYFSVEGR